MPTILKAINKVQLSYWDEYLTQPICQSIEDRWFDLAASIEDPDDRPFFPDTEDIRTETIYFEIYVADPEWKIWDENSLAKIEAGIQEDLDWEADTAIIERLTKGKNIACKNKFLWRLTITLNNLIDLYDCDEELEEEDELVDEYENDETAEDIVGEIEALFDDVVYDSPNIMEKEVALENIQEVVCNYYLIDRSEFISQKRSPNIVRPRQLAIFLSKELTDKSLAEIGDFFGGRDHTTVLNAQKKITTLLISDTGIKEDYLNLKKLINLHGKI